jgi:hypothetical protein
METIKITIKEYNQLLKITYCAESFLSTNNDFTKNRLIEYINELNK